MKFAYLTLFSGLLISAVAAWFSVTGLMAVFPAAAISIAIMGGSLELGKLVCATWLKRNWQTSPKFLKLPGIVFVAFLMLLTSAGIYGYLSKASAQLTQGVAAHSLQLASVDQKIAAEQKNIDRNQRVLNQLDDAIEVYTKEGKVTVGLRARGKQREERAAVAADISSSEQTIAALQASSLAMRTAVNDVAVEVGPAKNVAQLVYNDESIGSLEKAVRLFIFMIMFVFDPLAIWLLLMTQEEFKRKGEDVLEDDPMSLREEWERTVNGYDTMTSPAEDDEKVETAVGDFFHEGSLDFTPDEDEKPEESWHPDFGAPVRRISEEEFEIPVHNKNQRNAAHVEQKLKGGEPK